MLFFNQRRFLLYKEGKMNCLGDYIVLGDVMAKRVSVISTIRTCDIDFFLIIVLPPCKCDLY